MEIILIIIGIVAFLLWCSEGSAGDGGSSSTACRQCHGTGTRLTALGESSCWCAAGDRRVNRWRS
jgi:hypothetical protein